MSTTRKPEDIAKNIGENAIAILDLREALSRAKQDEQDATSRRFTAEGDLTQVIKRRDELNAEFNKVIGVQS